MILHVKVDGMQTVVLGYGPGKSGEPMAIVPFVTPGGQYSLKAVKLYDIEVLDLPKKLVKRLRRQRREESHVTKDE